MVIGSTTDTQPLLRNLEYNHLIVDEVYTSEMIQKYKPDEMFYRYILRSEGVGPDEAFFIGDSLVDDIAGPKRIGIRSVWVNREAKAVPPDAIQPEYIVSNIGEIEGLLCK